MGFFFCVFIAIVAYIGYRVYRQPFDAHVDASDPAYKDEFRTLLRELVTEYVLPTISEDSSIFEDKMVKGSRANSVVTARSAGSHKLSRTPTSTVSSESRSKKSGKKCRSRR